MDQIAIRLITLKGERKRNLRYFTGHQGAQSNQTHFKPNDAKWTYTLNKIRGESFCRGEAI